MHDHNHKARDDRLTILQSGDVFALLGDGDGEWIRAEENSAVQIEA